MVTFNIYDTEGIDMTAEQLPLADIMLNLDSAIIYEFTDVQLFYEVDIAGTTYGAQLVGWDLYETDPQILVFAVYDSAWNKIIDMQFWDSNYSFSELCGHMSNGLDCPGMLPGDDTIVSGVGNDVLTGLDGADLLGGQSGDDIIYAGNGNDAVYGDDGSDVLYGNQGQDYMNGGEGQDVLYGGQNEDELFGNQDDDTLYGHKGDDIIYAGQDDDALYGNQGSDELFGNKGDDMIFGGQDDDYLDGGSGDDLLWGNKGADFFYLSAGDDVIYDFSSADGDYLVGDITSTLSYQQIGADLLVSHSEGSVLLTNTLFGIDFSESIDVILL